MVAARHWVEPAAGDGGAEATGEQDGMSHTLEGALVNKVPLVGVDVRERVEQTQHAGRRASRTRQRSDGAVERLQSPRRCQTPNSLADKGTADLVRPANGQPALSGRS
jgi:hypothetical protein